MMCSTDKCNNQACSLGYALLVWAENSIGLDTQSLIHIHFFLCIKFNGNENEALSLSSNILSPSLASTFIIICSYVESLEGSFQGQVIFK